MNPKRLAPRYKKVLQDVYNPAGTTQDFTSTYASHSDPASEFKHRSLGIHVRR